MEEYSKVLTYDKTSSDILTLPALFNSAIERFGSKVVMKSKYPWGHQSITYREFDRLITILAEGLISRGLEKGDRVALLARNSPEWTVVYSAVTSCGGIIVPLDPELMKNEIRHLLIHSEAKFLITSPEIFDEKIEEMNLRDIYLIIIGERETNYQHVTLGEIMSLGKEKIGSTESEFFRFKSEVEKDDPAALCYTSGTTGGPKGALLTHGNITFDVQSSLERISFNQNDISLALLPLHHTFPTLACFLAPFLAGCQIVFGKSIRPDRIAQDIERENITVISGVPLLFEHMIKAIKEKTKTGKKEAGSIFKRLLSKIGRGLSCVFKGLSKPVRRTGRAAQLFNLRLCICGAAALRSDIEEAFQSAGIPLVQGYGLTETSPVVAVNPPERPKKGTVGPPLKGAEIKIDNPNSEGIGEILIKGPMVMKEYYKDPAATNRVIRNGWLSTGDLGKMDSDGYLTVAGRKKSMIVTAGGKNIYPHEIEMKLNSSPFILESMVVPLIDKKGNERVAAIIVPDYDQLGILEEREGKMTEQDIKNTIETEIKKTTTELADYKHITDFQIRDEELPKTTTRKIKRHLVKWIEE
jgi:long-chain acyl-CoA synthetase